MSTKTYQDEWLIFYEHSLSCFIKEMGYIPTFEEFKEIVLASDYDLGEE